MSVATNFHQAARDPDFIEIVGAREHNLRVDRLEVPKRKLVVFTGVSGSGKSSLAFDTLYAEGQRRYVESLSAYARQFLGQIEKPKYEHLRGLSPTIAIEQKSASGNPRSTVGTITEIYDYLRVLYAELGEQHCHVCGKQVAAQSAEEIVARARAPAQGPEAAPARAPGRAPQGRVSRALRRASRGRASRGCASTARCCRLDESAQARQAQEAHRGARRRPPNGRRLRSRALDRDVELGAQGRGRRANRPVRARRGARRFASASFAPAAGISFPELTPQSFSFNSPLGMCQACTGLGTRLAVDEHLVIARSVAVHPAGRHRAVGRGHGARFGVGFRIAEGVAKACAVDLDTPWRRLGKEKQQMVLYGLGGQRISVAWGKEGTETYGRWGMKFHGVIPTLMRRFQQTSSEAAARVTTASS